MTDIAKQPPLRKLSRCMSLLDQPDLVIATSLHYSMHGWSAGIQRKLLHAWLSTNIGMM